MKPTIQVLSEIAHHRGPDLVVPMRGKLALGATVGAVLMALSFLPGCSSSTKTASTPTTSGGTAASSSGPPATGGSATTKSAINVGSISSCTGPQKAAIYASCHVIADWAHWTNANGGLNGHPVKLINDDDAANPALSVSDVKSMVTKDHIIAMVFDSTTADSSWGSYLSSQNIPVIGGWDGGPEFTGNPDFFNGGTTQANLSSAVMQEIKAATSTPKLSIPYCSEVSACSQGATFEKKLASQYGIPVAWTQPFSESAPNYVAQCLSMEQAGANVMSLETDPTTVVRFAQGCAQQHYTPINVVQDGVASDAWQGIPALNGAVAVEGDAPWFSTATPALAQLHSAVAKYSPGITVDAESVYAWAAGQLFAAAYEAAGSPDNPTSAQIKQGLYALKGVTLGGLTPPLTYTPNQPSDIKCYFVIGIKDQKWALPQGLKTSCVS